MEFNSNVLNFPSTNNKLFKSAIEAYRKGDFINALKLAVSLIDRGDSHANTLAAAIYEKGGNGVEQDLAKALFYYQKSVDDAGSVEGWLALGRFHYFGKGQPQDYKKAFYYYSVVDEDTDNSTAHLMLGKMYLDGTGVNKNLAKARIYLEKAIKNGSVFGYTYMAELEKEDGHTFKSGYLRFKAGILAFFITLFNSNNIRLRRY